MKIEITPCELAELLNLLKSPKSKEIKLEIDGEKLAENIAKVTEKTADSVELDLEGMAKRARAKVEPWCESIIDDSCLKRNENWIKKQAEVLKQFHR